MFCGVVFFSLGATGTKYTRIHNPAVEQAISFITVLRMFLGLSDSFVSGTNPYPDPSIIKQK